MFDREKLEECISPSLLTQSMTKIMAESEQEVGKDRLHDSHIIQDGSKNLIGITFCYRLLEDEAISDAWQRKRADYFREEYGDHYRGLALGNTARTVLLSTVRIHP